MYDNVWDVVFWFYIELFGGYWKVRELICFKYVVCLEFGVELVIGLNIVDVFFVVE